jgi:hypothetical protein
VRIDLGDRFLRDATAVNGADGARTLGARLIERGLVTGWSLDDANSTSTAVAPVSSPRVSGSRHPSSGHPSAAITSALVVETRDPDRFFVEIVDLLLELELDLDLVGLRTLDEGAEAVFGYLLRRHEAGLAGERS